MLPGALHRVGRVAKIFAEVRAGPATVYELLRKTHGHQRVHKRS